MALPDAYVILRNFRRAHGRWPRLFPPQTFNEKLCWLMLWRRDPVLTQCADKYAVREYVTSRGLAAILNDLYGVWNTADAINFSLLPSSFVLKVAWGCGMNILCQDKTTLDPLAVRACLRDWLAHNHYWKTREWSYKAIPPRVIAERYLGPNLADYKIFCFQGEPALVQVDQNRFTRHTRDLFDCSWRPVPATYVYPPSGLEMPRPAQLTALLDCARTLAIGHPFVRVDLYAPDDARVVFGEMTWYPEGVAGRFSPEDFDRVLGTRLPLPS